MIHENQFVSLLTFGIIVSSLTLAGCAVENNKWGDPETGLILKYNIAPDQALNYKVISELNSTLEMMDQSIKTSTRTTEDYIIKGTGTDNKNNLLTTIIINDISINSSGTQGENTVDTSAVKGKSFGLSFSPKGEEKEYTGIDTIPNINMGPTAGEQSVKNSFLNPLPDLPDDGIKIGETWTGQREYKEHQGVEMTYNEEKNSILEGLDTVKGMECVRIKTETKRTFHGSGEVMGDEIEVNGNVKETIIWYFAYKEGLFVKKSVADIQNMKIDHSAMGEMSQVSEHKIEIDLVL